MSNLWHFCDATGEKQRKETNPKTRKAFIYFDSESSEPLGVRGVASSNLPVPTRTPALSLQSLAPCSGSNTKSSVPRNTAPPSPEATLLDSLNKKRKSAADRLAAAN